MPAAEPAVFSGVKKEWKLFSNICDIMQALPRYRRDAPEALNPSFCAAGKDEFMYQAKQINRRFLALQGLIASMDCIGVAFIVPILQGYGFDSLQIGFTMTLAAFAAFAAKPFWGFLNDRFCCARQGTLCGAVAGYGFFWLLTGADGDTTLIRISVMGLYLTFMCLMGFVDAWAVRLISDGYALNYGATRSGGSFCYAVIAVVFGVLLERYGSFSGRLLLGLLLVLLIFAVCMLPNPARASAKVRVSMREGIAVLRSNHAYLIVLCAYFLCTLSAAATDSFLSPRITALGGTQSFVGLCLFMQAISEVPIMLLYNRMRRRTGWASWQFLLLAMVFFGLKCFGVGIAPSYPVLLLAAMLHGLSFALLTPAIVDFVLDTVPTRYLSTAHLLCGAVGSSLGAMAGNSLNGLIADRIGVAPMMIVVSVFSFAGAALIGYYFKRRRPQT